MENFIRKSRGFFNLEKLEFHMVGKIFQVEITQGVESFLGNPRGPYYSEMIGILYGRGFFMKLKFYRGK